MTFALHMTALLLAVRLAGPGDVVRGRVLGPDGRPLAAQTVVLHRVAGTSGLTVGTAVSDAAGNFALQIADTATLPDAVYFLAARYGVDGELYIGDAFRAPFDSTLSHTVQVGTPGTSARALLADPTVPATAAQTRQDDPTRWLVWALPALALVALSFMTLGRRARVPPRRRILLEIARLDESSPPGDPQYLSRRAELLAQLGRPAEV